MQYVTKKQHRTRYVGFPFDLPNAYLLNKHHLELNGIADFDADSVTPEQYLAILNATNSTAFDAMPFDFTWDLNLTGTVLDIKFINNTENNRIISHMSVDMDYLKTADAGTLWYINDDTVSKSVRKYDLHLDAEMLTVDKGDLVNSLAKTLEDRNFNILGVNSLVSFYVAKDNPTPDDIVIVIIRPVVSTDPDYNEILPEMVVNNIPIAEGEADNTVTVTGNLTKHPKDPLLKLLFELLPEITVTSSTVSGDIITVNFTTDENGSFKVVTTGMDPGDLVKVKMGFKYWVNRNTFTKTL
jgi:hypothetical protein